MDWAETYRQWTHDTKRFIKNWLATVNEHPVLILGHQKSGTSAIAALLARHAGLEETCDLRRQPPLTLVDEYQGESLVDELVRRHRIEFSRDIIKDPEFTFLYTSLQERFPHAQFVMIARDPRDNIRSILNRLRIPGNQQSPDFSEHEEVNGEWRKILESDYLSIDRDHYIARLAVRWSRAVEVNQEYESEKHLIRYEDFCADKTGAIANLAQRLDLSQRHDISGEVDVQYQPRGNREVSWAEFFGVENLTRIERICRERARALGYPV